MKWQGRKKKNEGRKERKKRTNLSHGKESVSTVGRESVGEVLHRSSHVEVLFEQERGGTR